LFDFPNAKCYNQDMKRKSFRVVVNLDIRNLAAREIVVGVLKFAWHHPLWDVQLRGNHPSNDGFNQDPDWKPDGIIIDGTWATDDGRRLIACPTIRGAVFISDKAPGRFRKPQATVVTDDRALATIAARTFIQRGIRNFAFIGARQGGRWCERRKRLFHAAVKDAGFAVSDFRMTDIPGVSWTKERNAMAEWLNGLPKPCGVWAANDLRAKHVLDLCRQIGICVPEQLQVLGVDNENYICEQTTPPLSSIEPNFDNGGYAAAEVLNEILSGRKPKTKEIKVPVGRLVERVSTLDLSGAGTRVSRAQEFIRLNATRGISVASVVKIVGGSGRLLEKNFSTVVGHSVCREIQNVRLQEVCQRLMNTQDPIVAIATSCAFPNANYLMALFKRKFGVSMSDFRRKHLT
jgi:LacI family transcriptional regulator